ncbi:DKNYY domain-containing protein [Mycolicibacterium sp. BiH015]|uniref:DKNYY domain-containing protein n=1 Tax=Mycolicibacterium sp. BiH015 TaxID=3018808 RepID=UPI0022E2BF48|nr:DKNYY domain-containing protein [Mycolicibacterium sp. BiH015]MDA2889570.1 DKNYY domain-containing protein [Mycolicibacterium sp. BiH015]
MRRLLATAAVAVLALLAGCSSGDEPSSLVDAAGYHIRDDTVYYLNPFPGKAFRVDGADSSTFEVFDRTYARDRAQVYINGHRLDGADADSFQLLDRPGFSKDRHRVYQHDQPISDDPANFAFLGGDLSRDSTNVYWTDGSVLSRDPGGFVIIADEDHYLFAKDGEEVFVNGRVIVGASPATFRILEGAYSRDAAEVFYFDAQIPGADAATFRTLEGPYAADEGQVYWMGKPIPGADPATFEVLNANFECAADRTRAYYRQAAIQGADPAAFPSGRTVTGCSETTISFGD